MDVAESRRLKDIESLKAQLRYAKQQMDETVKKTEILRSKLKEEKLQYSKTLHSLQKTQSEQNIKLNKLNSDIKNYENLYMNQSIDKNNYLEIINKMTKELETLTKESEKQISESQKLCLELDKEVKCGFVKCQTDQEMVIVWELGSSFKTPEEEKAFKKIFFKIKAEVDKRFENFKQEMTKMDETIIRLREEIREKRETFSLAEAKYLALKGMPQLSDLTSNTLEDFDKAEKLEREGYFDRQ